MTDKEVMQMALDALEDVADGAEESHKTVAAIEAIRARLAQPEPTLALWNFKHNRLAGLSDDRAEVVLIRQREWKGLTDEDWIIGKRSADYIAGAEWAEAKLKEKNSAT